jgi:hypothetical protein
MKEIDAEWAQRERNAKQVAKTPKETENTPAHNTPSDTKGKTYEVSKGFMRGTITVEIDPRIAHEISLKDFEWDLQLTAKMTWEQPGGPVFPRLPAALSRNCMS